MFLYTGLIFFITGLFEVAKTQDTTDPILCNLTTPNMCPSGQCCVRDEFLFSYTYCRSFGTEGQPCSIKPSMFECHCTEGLTCISNIHGIHDSLFGHCRKAGHTTTNNDTSSLVG